MPRAMPRIRASTDFFLIPEVNKRPSGRLFFARVAMPIA